MELPRTKQIQIPNKECHFENYEDTRTYPSITSVDIAMAIATVGNKRLLVIHVTWVTT